MVVKGKHPPARQAEEVDIGQQSLIWAERASRAAQTDQALQTLPVFLSVSTRMGILLRLILLFPGLCSLSSSVPRQFHLVKEWKSWTEAQQYCRQEFTDLATIDNMTELEKVKSLIRDAGVGQAWIGLKQGSSSRRQWSLRDDQVNKVRGGYNVWIGPFRDAWDWSDGSSSSFRNWESGQPSFNSSGDFCARVTSSGLWSPATCTSHASFICYEEREKIKRQIVRVELQTDSQVDMDDPAVQAAILQQIQQRLREKGMPATAKLTWRSQPDGKIFQKEK